ncbi:MAG: NAD(P)-dependent glycerol-3-phosphate dehydrogenase [Gammaproteobacteria bacterium]|nr:NAD(P)-dependent glycerol-3-phosphate dehydrogenase [Gammaproteobacteria bacterium]
MSDQPTVALFGAGSWGTALAMQLARNGARVNLWGHDPEHIARLIKDGENKAFLPGIVLHENIYPVTSLVDCQHQADTVLIAIPSKAFRDFLIQLHHVIKPGLSIFWASKGFEIESGKLLHQLVIEELPGHHYGVISGPTFATEVARGLPAAITCAGDNPCSTAFFADLLHGSRFRCYTSDDVIGVELGGALKNILAIAVGAADGLGFGANTRAALMTRGLSEVMRLGERLGAKQETLMGLAGLGDLILTCTDDQSRNRRFGLAIGEGKTVVEAEIDVGQTVEGLRAARAIYLLSQELGLELPIMEQVYRVLYENVRPVDAVQSLENRPQRPENSD